MSEGPCAWKNIREWEVGTPVYEPSPKAAATFACRQLVAPAYGSVLSWALEEAGEWLTCVTGGSGKSKEVAAELY